MESHEGQSALSRSGSNRRRKNRWLKKHLLLNNRRTCNADMQRHNVSTYRVNKDKQERPEDPNPHVRRSSPEVTSGVLQPDLHRRSREAGVPSFTAEEAAGWTQEAAASRWTRRPNWPSCQTFRAEPEPELLLRSISRKHRLRSFWLPAESSPVIPFQRVCSMTQHFPNLLNQKTRTSPPIPPL